IEPFPYITEYGGTACGGFKQSAGGAISRASHGQPRHVQRQPSGTVKGRMLRRRQMANEENIRLPGKLMIVHGAGEHELAIGQATSGLHEKSVQHLIAISGERAQVTQVRPVARIGRRRFVDSGIDTAIERSYVTGDAPRAALHSNRDTGSIRRRAIRTDRACWRSKEHRAPGRPRDDPASRGRGTDHATAWHGRYPTRNSHSIRRSPVSFRPCLRTI